MHIYIYINHTFNLAEIQFSACKMLKLAFSASTAKVHALALLALGFNHYLANVDWLRAHHVIFCITFRCLLHKQHWFTQ